MLELQNYDIEDDYSKNVLKDHLINTKLTKLDNEILKKISVWDFIEGKTKGGAYELDFANEEEIILNKNFMPKVEGHTHIKYISLNKVKVSVLGGVSGAGEQLFIIRDLTTMVNL